MTKTKSKFNKVIDFLEWNSISYKVEDHIKWGNVSVEIDITCRKNSKEVSSFMSHDPRDRLSVFSLSYKENERVFIKRFKTLEDLLEDILKTLER